MHDRRRAYFGSQPTGRAVAVQGIVFARTAGERVVENWMLIDQMGLLQQLGIIPPPRGGV
jgi:predicted ester cyclase